jgi:hypothetical protein
MKEITRDTVEFESEDTSNIIVTEHLEKFLIVTETFINIITM